MSKSIRSVLEDFAYKAEDDIESANVICEETFDQALKDIAQIIDEAKPSDLVSYPSSDDEWFREVRTYNNATGDYQSNLREALL